MTDANALPGEAADRLWAFSVAVYGRPEVAPACLALQDDHDLDVNVLLFCCWAAAEGAPPLADAAIADAVAAAEPWRARVVAPLRAVRRDLKRAVSSLADISQEDFRQRVAALELEAERLTQGLLVQAVPFIPDPARTPAQRLEAGAVNLAGYAAAWQLSPAPGTELAVVLAAATDAPAGAALTAVEAAIRSRAGGAVVL